MAKRKKPTRIISLPQTTENQIRTRARNLKIGECYISRDWEEIRECNILITRQHQQGGVTLGIFLVDLALLGVKESFYRFNMPPAEYEDFIRDYKQREPIMEIGYTLAHNIIYGALEYADEYNFKPDKDFAVAKYILEDDTEEIPLIEVEFGADGLPTVFCSSENPRKAEIRQLEQLVGKGNFQVIDLGDKPDYDLDTVEEEELEEERWADEDELEAFVDPEVVDAYVTEVDFKEIYRRCDAIYKLKPWKKLTEADGFAIKLPGSGKEILISVMGNGGEMTALSFYQGGRAMYKFWEIHYSEVHVHPSRILTIPHIMLSWEDHKDLEGTQSAITEKLGISYKGKQSWPQFQQIKPGFVPFIPDSKEFKTIGIILDQCLEVLPRAIKDPLMLWEDPDATSTVLFRIPEKSGDGWLWREEFRSPADDPALTKLNYNPLLLQEYLELPILWKSLQLELQLLPFPLRNPRGIARFPFMLIALDPKEDLILLSKMLDSSRRYETHLRNLPNIVMEQFIEVGGRPASIEFSNPDIHLLMQFMEDKTKTQPVFQNNLGRLEQAIGELIEAMGK